MSELERWINLYLEDLQRRNSSVHTIRNYGADLQQFLAYFSSKGLRRRARKEHREESRHRTAVKHQGARTSRNGGQHRSDQPTGPGRRTEAFVA